MCRLLNAVLLLLLLKATSIATEPTEILFLISSQDSSYHNPLSAHLRDDIINQAQTQLANTDYIIKVHVLHEILNFPSYWVIKNVMPLVHSQLLGKHTKWVIWCEESTHISLLTLLEQLALEDATQLVYLGHTLYDKQATARHHFAFHEIEQWFPFPFQRAGIVFSRALISITAEALRKSQLRLIIDMEYELALFIYNNVTVSAEDNGGQGIQLYANESTTDTNEATTRKGKTTNTMRKVLMRKVPYICPRVNDKVSERTLLGTTMTATLAANGDSGVANKKCAMYAQRMDMSSCVYSVQPQHIFFAVKTCEKFHKDRIPIIKATWAPIANHIRYYSDVADFEIPTISTGVPNTELGHCKKTFAILSLAMQEIEQINQQLENTVSERDDYIRWLVLADDDTLLSIPGLCDLLGCFNHTHDMYLGDRYGFYLNLYNGYNYITGGGGVALSLSAVKKILLYCDCKLDDEPEDMRIGNCLDTLEVQAIHSTRFHQYRPMDYPDDMLALEPPVSFHKFYDTDPFALYEQYFAEADRRLMRTKN